MIKLSLCMATYKRAAFIGETIESILPQLTDEVELVIVEGASPDDTQAVVAPYLERHPHIRYYRETENSGIDGDFDKTVDYASGEYCWLTTDDDLLAPGAIARVLDAIRDEGSDLFVVDGEVRDATLTRLIERRRMSFSGTRSYGPDDADRMLVDSADVLSFIGAVVIRRSLWLARERKAYYGTVFIHVGVIFQSPIDKVTLIGEPLVIMRLGNAMWTPNMFEIWMFKWPDLIWSFPDYGDHAKHAVIRRLPWTSTTRLLLMKASGAFGRREYRTFIAHRPSGARRLVMWGMLLIPGRLANMIAMLGLAARGQAGGVVGYNLATASPYSNGVSRAINRRAPPPRVDRG